MATLPPVTLGAIIMGAFAVAAGVRPWLLRRLVASAPISRQPRRQFTVEFGMCLAAGLLATAFNTAVFDFPLGSGISLMFGCAVAGFFLSLDMSLIRERVIILESMDTNESLPPPKRLFPVTRKFSLVALATVLFVAMVIVLVISRDIVWLSKIEQTPEAFWEAQLSVTYEIFFVMGVLLIMIINLIISYARNLQLLFRNETRVLERVGLGDLSQFVPVTTNDEFGLIADYTNLMIRALRHRIELLGALKLAEEVQRSLLPHTPPQLPGLEISGTSLYCQETGGDYFDYLPLTDGRLAIVVADASDHGVGAALHMSGARAYLVFGARHYDSPADLLNRINEHLVNDSANTGRFVAAFILEIDTTRHRLRWVRAGHEPGLLYDPRQDRFDLLDGEGLVLGADADYRYRQSVRSDWPAGGVIVIGTDGLHETRNTDGEMFGRKRLQDIIRRHGNEGAERIRDAVIEDIRRFQEGARQEDDLTLVVAKLQ